MSKAEIIRCLEEQAQYMEFFASKFSDSKNEQYSKSLRQAVHLIEKLSADRDTWKLRADAALRDLRSVIKHADDGCLLCAHYHPCAGKDCPQYISGTGATDKEGKEYPDFKWSCDDFEYGTCPAMENTPCNGCDFENHWEWRGLCEENGGEHE